MTSRVEIARALQSVSYTHLFLIGFVLAAVSQLTLIAIGALGLALTLLYLQLESKGGGNGGSSNGGQSAGDPLGDILDDY